MRGGIVRQVGVHLHDDVVAALDADREAGAVRASPSPIFSVRTQHVDLPELVVPRLVGQLGGAVGAVVVDDEDVDVGRGGADALQELGDVAPLPRRSGTTTIVRMRRRG